MGRLTQIAILLALFSALASADLVRQGRRGRRLGNRQRQRQGRQEAEAIQGRCHFRFFFQISHQTTQYFYIVDRFFDNENVIGDLTNKK